MALNYVTVTGTFDDGSGNPIPATGQQAYCQFTPNQAVYASGVPLITPAQPVQASISNGAMSVRLLATDNTGLTFGGLTGFFYWTVTLYIGGQAQPSWSFFLPGAPSTTDLSKLANTAAGNAGFTNPMTTLGDLIYENATPAAARLPGDVSNSRKFLRTQASGGVAQAPAWDILQAGDVPQLPDYAPTGLTGATASSRYGGATAGGPPASGTWLTGDWVADPVRGSIWICTAGGTPGKWRVAGQPASWFDITAYGAVGDGQLLTDGVMASGGSTLTTAGLAAPSAPSLSNSGSGGTILAGTYQVIVTLVNAWGETVGSTAASTTTTGTTSTITVTTPALPAGNASGYYVYCTQPGGSTFTRQQAAGQPTVIGQNYTLTAPPTNTGANPPVSNTTASLPFTAQDVGKLVMVKGAGAVNVTTATGTITGYNSPGSVTCSFTNASGGGITGAEVFWATDDNPAILLASADMQPYAKAHGSARLYSPAAPKGLYYGLGGALDTSHYGNAQVPLSPLPMTGPAASVEIAGDGSGTTTHWLQASSQVQGSTWVSFGLFQTQAAQGNSINSFGDPCVLGGPSWGGFGGVVNGNVLQSNMHVRITNMNILTAHSAFGWTYAAVNLLGVAKCSTENFSYSTTGLFLNGFAAGDFNSPGAFGNGFSKGFLPPNNGSNDCNEHRNLTCYGGYTWGLLATEHFDGHGVRILYCANGFCPVGNYSGALSVTGVGSTHKIRWSKMSIEGCPNEVYIFGTGSGGTGPWLEGAIDTESNAPTFTDSGGNGMKNALGRITLAGLYTASAISVPVTGLEIINGQQATGPVALSLVINTAKQNTTWQWLTVTLAGGTGITSVQIGNTMGGTVAPAMTTFYSQAAAALPPVTVKVPPGGWIQVNGTTIPTVSAMAG